MISLNTYSEQPQQQQVDTTISDCRSAKELHQTPASSLQIADQHSGCPSSNAANVVAAVANSLPSPLMSVESGILTSCVRPGLKLGMSLRACLISIALFITSDPSRFSRLALMSVELGILTSWVRPGLKLDMSLRTCLISIAFFITSNPSRFSSSAQKALSLGGTSLNPNSICTTSNICLKLSSNVTSGGHVSQFLRFPPQQQQVLLLCQLTEQ
nr:hypothetical protein Itr_chr06CG18270 [Ipomoea trifida]